MQRNFLKKSAYVLLAFFLVSTPLPAYADTTGGSGTGDTTGGSGILINPLGDGATLESFIGNILDTVIYIGSFVIVFMLVYVGFLFVKAQGSDSEISQAREALLWTVIGALVLLGAKAIQLGIQETVKALSGGS